jgi:threonine dehydrogenase-like Zn-dependent dehydrogenase
MKAAVFKGVGQPLSVESIPDPTPGPGEFVLRINRCGICGSDLHMTDGTAPMQYSVGSVPGHEFSGEVVAVGSGVTHIATGDFVTAMRFSGCGACPSCRFGRPIFARVLDSGAVQARAMITDQVSLDELPSAFEALRQRTHQCKVMVVPFAASRTTGS